MSSSTPGEAPAGRALSVEIDSESITHTRPGIGRFLARAAAVALLGDVALLLVSSLLKAIGPASLASSMAWIGPLGWLAFRVAPALGVLSALFTSFSFPRPGPAKVKVTGEGVRITRGRRSRLIPRAKIRDGLFIPRLNRERSLVLHLRGGDKLSILVNTEGEAVNSLDVLGVGADRRRTEQAMSGPGAQLIGGCVTFGVASIGLLIALVAMFDKASWGAFFNLALALLIAITWAVFRSLRPTEVAVGTDGVRIRRPWSTQFISYSRIEGVGATSEYLWMDVRREALGSSTIEHVKVSSKDETLPKGLAARIQEVMARGAAASEDRAAGDFALEEQLEPRGRSLEAWRGALRSLAKEEAGYRKRGLSFDDLLAILRNPEAPVARRIGAALALRSLGKPEAEERIRVAADSCASDAARAALTRAATDELDEATLEQALAEATSEEKRQRMIRS